MKKSVALLSLVLIGSIFAETYRVPQEDPVAIVRLPANWKTQHHEEFVESTTSDGSQHVLVLPGEGRKVAEAMNEAMRYIRRKGTIKVNAASEKRANADASGKQVKTFSWDATQKDKPIKIHFHVVSVLEGKPLIVVFWESLEAERKYQRDLNTILKTLAAP